MIATDARLDTGGTAAPLPPLPSLPELPDPLDPLLLPAPELVEAAPTEPELLEPEPLDELESLPDTSPDDVLPLDTLELLALDFDRPPEVFALAACACESATCWA